MTNKNGGMSVFTRAS